MEKVEQLSYFAVQLCTDETEDVEIHKRITQVNKAYFAVFHPDPETYNDKQLQLMPAKNGSR